MCLAAGGPHAAARLSTRDSAGRRTLGFSPPGGRDAWTTRHLDRAGAWRVLLRREEAARTLALAWSGHDRVQEGPGNRHEGRGAASGGRSDKDRRDARGGDGRGEAPHMIAV